MTSTEIAKAGPTGLATQPAPVYGGDASDFLIPRIYGVQKTSKLIEDARAKFGEIVRSTTGEVLGGLGKGIPFIPLKQWKTWLITEGGKFVGTEPFTPANSGYAYEFDHNGQKRRRERVLNFYVLLPGDIIASAEARKIFDETGDTPDKMVSLVPCAIGFKSTSYKAGRALTTHFAQMEDFGAEPYLRWLLLDSTLESNDKGKFAVLHVTEGGAVKDKGQKAICEKWYKMMGGGAAFKIDEDDVESEVIDIGNKREEF